MSSKSLKDLKINVWPSDWGLISIDADCIAVMAYTNIVEYPSCFTECLPHQTSGGHLPEVVDEEENLFGLNKILEYFVSEGFDADEKLNPQQKADSFAYMSYIEQHLKPSVTYTLWIDEDNFNNMTRPCYGKLFGFPRNLWKVGQIREKAKMFITQGNQNTINDLKKSLYIKAKECMNVFEVQLKKKNFIFGKPSTIDAVIYGYLALLSKAPFSSLELKNHLLSCDNLMRFCDQMNKLIKKSSDFTIKPPQLVKQPIFLKKDTVITIGVGLSAMILYGLIFGVFTSKRSILAQQLGTISKKN